MAEEKYQVGSEVLTKNQIREDLKAGDLDITGNFKEWYKSKTIRLGIILIVYGLIRLALNLPDMTYSDLAVLMDQLMDSGLLEALAGSLAVSLRVAKKAVV